VQQTVELLAVWQGKVTLRPQKSGRCTWGRRKSTKNGHDLHIRGLYFVCKNTCTHFM